MATILTSSAATSGQGFPVDRPRRRRRTAALRAMVRETRLAPAQLIAPFFVCHGKDVRNPVGSMPGVAQLSVDGQLDREVGAAVELGIRSVILFGLPAQKDAVGSENFDPDGIIARAIHRIRTRYPDVCIITDLCCCEYTSHGHCGLLDATGYVRNDATLPLLARAAVAYARAGADCVAPSDMMDGRIGAIRAALDGAGFESLPIVSSAAKYASGYYGPFRDAAHSTPAFGDRKAYQMDPANSDEALREVALDLEEGADLVMVKPAGPYLDIVRRVKETFRVPTAAYQVSGEYALIKAAAERGWIDERRVALESLVGIRRAGADVILTYYAVEAARWLAEGRS